VTGNRKGSRWVTVRNATEGAYKFATPQASRVVFSLQHTTTVTTLPINLSDDAGCFSHVVAFPFAGSMFAQEAARATRRGAVKHALSLLNRRAHFGAPRQNAYPAVRSSVTKSCSLTSVAARSMSFAAHHLHVSLAMRVAVVEAR
jgi:hypothetical protein